MLAIAGLWGSCSVVVDADRAQCVTDQDCEQRGAAFGGSVCMSGLCRPAKESGACADGGACTAEHAATRADACVGARCQDAARSKDARTEVEPDSGEQESPEGDAESPPDAEVGHDDVPVGPPGECAVDQDCEARGMAGAICVDAVCWQAMESKQCSADAECAAFGPEYRDGKCVDARCLPNPRWRCAPPAPSSPSDSLTLHILVRDSLSLSPVRNLRAIACEKLDLDCVAPVTEATTDRDGQLVLEVPRGFAGYVRIENPDFFPALYFLPAVLPSDGQLDPFPLLGIGVVDALALSIGSGVDPRRGHMMLIAEDCFGAALPGVSFESKQEDSSTIQFYVRDLLPTTSATETGDVGNGGYLNFPAGNAVIDLTEVELGLKLTTSSIVIRPGFISVAYIRPDVR